MTALIVDDEELAREELKYLLDTTGSVDVLAEGKNGVEAVDLIRTHHPDVVFLDVQMPGLDGFAVLKKLLELGKGEQLPQIIFATAYDQYAVRAFDVNAMRVDTLLKLIEQHQAPKPHSGKIVLQAGSRLLLVDQKDICYASIDDGVISVVTPTIEGQSKCRTLEELFDLLDPAVFWRAHRSFLVNINHIREVVPWFKSSYQLRMDDKKQTEVPVSRAQTRRLRELFNL